MSKNQIKNVAKQVAKMDAIDQLKIVHASDDELPKVLEDLGLTLPASTWWLRVLKVLLYAAGILLAGIGTATTANALNLF